MQLSMWIYEGLFYVGVMCIVVLMCGFYYVLYVLQGDIYVDLLFIMIEWC